MKMSCNPANNLNYYFRCSFTGALIALSGIADVDLLVNGPSSCTGFATGMVDSCHPLKERSAMAFSRIAQKGHPRIPCSEITDADVILGVGEKLVEAADLLIEKRDPAVIAVVNTCSLSLIGEDVPNILKEHPAADRLIFLESTGCTRETRWGFEDALIRLIDKTADPSVEPEPDTVNIIGLPIHQYSWKHDLRKPARSSPSAPPSKNLFSTKSKAIVRFSFPPPPPCSSGPTWPTARTSATKAP